MRVQAAERYQLLSGPAATPPARGPTLTLGGLDFQDLNDVGLAVLTGRPGSAAEALVGCVVRHDRVGEGGGEPGCEDASALEGDSGASAEGISGDFTVP